MSATNADGGKCAQMHAPVLQKLLRTEGSGEERQKGERKGREVERRARRRGRGS